MAAVQGWLMLLLLAAAVGVEVHPDLTGSCAPDSPHARPFVPDLPLPFCEEYQVAAGLCARVGPVVDSRALQELGCCNARDAAKIRDTVKQVGTAAQGCGGPRAR